MFKQARNNSYIYILTKGQNPILETGVIQTVSQPRMGQFNPQQQQNPYQYPQPMVVDIVATVGQERRNLQGLPAELDIADYNGNIVVTTDKAKIANEIQILYKAQEDIVNGHNRAKELMGIYGGMLTALNPEEAKAKAQDDKIAYLENALAKAIEGQNQTQAMLQQLMSKFDASSNNKPSKTKE